MEFRRDPQGQMILLAGVLIVLAYLLLSTQSALMANIGQQAGREVANPLLGDYAQIRGSLASTLEAELEDASGDAQCPDDLSQYGGRVQTLLLLLGELEANRGQVFQGHFLSASRTFVDATNDLLLTKIDLYLTNGFSTVADQLEYTFNCKK